QAGAAVNGRCLLGMQVRPEPLELRVGREGLEIVAKSRSVGEVGDAVAMVCRQVGRPGPTVANQQQPERPIAVVHAGSLELIEHLDECLELAGLDLPEVGSADNSHDTPPSQSMHSRRIVADQPAATSPRSFPRLQSESVAGRTRAKSVPGAGRQTSTVAT